MMCSRHSSPADPRVAPLAGPLRPIRPPAKQCDRGSGVLPARLGELGSGPGEVAVRRQNVRAVCDSCPAAICHTPPCPARSELESSLPFVLRFLKESAPSDTLEAYFKGLPQVILNDREVSLAAVVASHTALVHPRWTTNCATRSERPSRTCTSASIKSRLIC